MTSTNCPIRRSTSKDNACLRHCKIYLRRRLASGPPILSHSTLSQPGEKRCSRDGGKGGNAPGAGSSRWGHFWPVGRHDQCEELRKVLHRTVIDGESQSALLLGCRGSGKSLVLDRVLRSLAEEAERSGGGGGGRGKRRKSSGDQEGLEGAVGSIAVGQGLPRPPFRAVYLNGAAQTDDGVAMREVVQQLGVTGTQRDGYSSNLEMAVESMKTGAVNGVPVVFVLDDFERFACRRPQTLLYALLDLCQDKTICAAVVGLSINLNVLDVAEKRIKSRFSFQQVRLPPQNFETLLAILSDALTIPEGRDNDDGEEATRGDGDTPSQVPGVNASFARRFNAVTRQTLGGAGGGSSSTNARAALSGFAIGTGRAGARSARADLKALAASGRSIGWFLRLTSTAVALLDVADGSGCGGVRGSVGREGAGESPGLTRQALLRAAEMLAPDPYDLALRSLSVTQLVVLVAVARLECRGRKRDGCSFQAVFQEYECYLRKFPKCHLRFSKAVIFKAYRELAEQGLLRAAESSTGGGREAHPMLHARFRSRLGCDEIYRAMREEVVRAPTNVVQWCKEWQRDA